MEVELTLDRRDFDIDMEKAKAASIVATKRALERMGLFVEANAVRIVVVASSRLKQSLRKTDVEYDRTRGVYRIQIGSDLDYSVFLELGFQGHFVPFHIAPDMFNQARLRWGWRIPSPDLIPNPRDAFDRGKKWLVPRGRKRPVWGVFVRGTEKPFLRPALDLLTDRMQMEILRAEFQKELARL